MGNLTLRRLHFPLLRLVFTFYLCISLRQIQNFRFDYISWRIRFFYADLRIFQFFFFFLNKIFIYAVGVCCRGRNDWDCTEYANGSSRLDLRNLFNLSFMYRLRDDACTTSILEWIFCLWWNDSIGRGNLVLSCHKLWHKCLSG